MVFNFRKKQVFRVSLWAGVALALYPPLLFSADPSVKASESPVPPRLVSVADARLSGVDRGDAPYASPERPSTPNNSSRLRVVLSAKTPVLETPLAPPAITPIPLPAPPAVTPPPPAVVVPEEVTPPSPTLEAASTPTLAPDPPGNKSPVVVRVAPALLPAGDSSGGRAWRPEAEGPRRWLRRPVFFNLLERPVAEFLADFASTQGVASKISPRLAGSLSGRFEFSNPGELLDLVCQIRHINWYFDGSTVHFYSETELENRMFSLDGKNEAELRTTLGELDLYDPRFPWKLADAGRLLLLQAPPAYLERVEDILTRQSVPEPEPDPVVRRKLGVFRLNHAWAAEQVLTSGDSTVRVPGVADLLQKILTGDTGAVGGVAQTLPTLSGTPRLAKGTGVVGRANALKEAEAEAAPPAARGTAFIQADPRLNAVLVWDYEDNLPFIQEIVESLDQPLPLVEIRAAIIDIEAGKTSDLGISLRYQGDKGRWENTAGSNLGSSSSPVDFSNISGNGFQYATIYSWGLDQLMARVSAMEEDGNANILSRPSVLTQDNIQATLEHTETFYVRLQGEREVDLADITTGLTLRVTPHVINNGEGGVQLAVYITDGDDANSNVDGLPRVRQSSISTQAIVHEGEALVIGGYYNETRRLTDTGVPGLKNIPLFGALFRNKEKTNNKSERLFVLSPRIITPGQSPYAPGSESERSLDYSPARDLLQGPAMPDPVLEKKPGRGGKKR